MRRFFVDGLSPDVEKVEIRGEEFAHLKKVLRLGEGSAVAVFDGRGTELAGVIETVEKDRAVMKVEVRSVFLRESPLRLILIQGLPKGEKTDFIIQKATELGAAEVRFYASARAVAKMPAARSGAKTLRWRRITIEAAKQSGRSVVPEVMFFEDLAGASAGLEGAAKVALWENEKAASIVDFIKKALSGNGACPRVLEAGVAALVGPEGGLSEEDVEEARGQGFTPVRFGPRILRAETAAISVMTVLQYALGDLR